jgi:hypothetical protein
MDANEDLPRLQVMTNYIRGEEDKKTFFCPCACHKSSKTASSSVVPNFQPRMHLASIVVARIMKRFHRNGATIGCIPLTKEYRLHGLTEEPLTLFPDGKRCPLSTALPWAISVALPGVGLGSERELVGGS